MGTRTETDSDTEASHESEASPTLPRGSAPVETPIAPGDCLGRYTVREQIGRGGMGDVFAAHDPELDRVVALKVIRPDLAGRSPEARARFQREAHAMARLNHPNVVSVFDVGAVNERVYVAMELVAGPTLAAWLAQRPRGWREVVQVFLAAGRGLEAAHAAGLVHRDFKPSNVIIGDRVRVADFGLARAASDSDAPPLAATTPLRGVITETGDAIGTPWYMAPEQVTGAPPSPLGDQYSFGVALREALYGMRPGEDVPDPGRKVPGWLRAIVERALRRRPEERYPSLRELLADLGRDPGRTRRRWLAAAAVAALAAGGVVAQRELARPSCAGAEARLAGVWDGARKDAVRAAFLATKLPYAEDTWRRTSSRIDDYAAGWVDMNGETCRATRVDGRQSDTLMDLRMACLGRGRAVLGALTHLWAGGMDSETLAAATGAAGDLPPLARCADPESLVERVPLPSAPSRVAEIGTARATLALAEALTLAHRWTEARTAATAARAAADATGWAPVRAEAAFAEGNVLSRMEDPGAEPLLMEAARLAGEAHDDHLAARALVELVEDLAEHRRKAERALLVADVAASWVARSGDERLNARLLKNRGVALVYQEAYPAARAAFIIARARFTAAFGPEDPESLVTASQLARLADLEGNYAAARALHEENLTATIAVLGPEHPRIGSILNNVAVAAAQAGDYDAAAGYFRRALAIMEKVTGPDGVWTAYALSNLGSLEATRGNIDEAQRLLERACAIRERVLGPEHTTLGVCLSNLAGVRRKQGRHPHALELLERALAIASKAHGPRHPSVADALSEIGEVLVAKGDAAGALGYFRRALDIREAALGADHAETLLSLVPIARIMVKLGRCAQARASLATATGRLEKSVGADHPLIAQALAARATCDLAEGHTAEALAGLDRAMAIQEKAKVAPVDRGAVRWIVARAHWGLGRHDEAVAAARQAERELAGDADGAQDLAAVRAWLAARPR